MSSLYALKVNSVYMRVECEADVAHELWDHFAFEIPNAKHTPKVKSGQWDGLIRLFNPRSQLMYIGLLEELKQFCIDSDYALEIDDRLLETTPFSEKVFDAFVANVLKLESKYVPRPAQKDAVLECIQNNRRVIISPTASGKSLIIYMLIRYYLNHPKVKGGKILLIVPAVSLVTQMFKDFQEYCSTFDVEQHVHTISAGDEKSSDKPIVITTWQSIQNQPKPWFNDYRVVIVDETHRAKAAELKNILSNLVNADFRFGFTGTLDNIETNRMIITGLLGPVKQFVTTQELIDDKTLSNMNIEMVFLKYPYEVSRLLPGASYLDEMKFILPREDRMKILSDYVQKQRGNTVVMYNLVETHGKPMFEYFQKHLKNKKLFFISGKIKPSVREEIRQFVQGGNECVIVANYKVFAEGINLPRIHNIILGAPISTKTSEIAFLQSLGRGLRKDYDKDVINIVDLVDENIIKNWKSHATRHGLQRYLSYKKNFPNEDMTITKLNV